MSLLDIDALSSGGGVIGALFYMVAMLIRRRKFNPIDGGVVFIAVVAIVAGGEIIYVAIIGDIHKLPSAWRAYISVAAIIGIGVSLQKLWDLLYVAFFANPKPKAVKPD